MLLIWLDQVVADEKATDGFRSVKEDQIVMMELSMLSVFGKQFIRSISTSACACGKKNFKKFPLYNKRGTRNFKEQQAKHPHPDVPIHSNTIQTLRCTEM